MTTLNVAGKENERITNNFKEETRRIKTKNNEIDIPLFQIYKETLVVHFLHLLKTMDFTRCIVTVNSYSPVPLCLQ